MTPDVPTDDMASKLSQPEVEFETSADGLPVARVCDTVFAMVPGAAGRHFLGSAWHPSRPLAELKRSDFYSHQGAVENETVFRLRMLEQAEHAREVRGLRRQSVRMDCSTPWGPSQSATVYADGIVSHMTAGHGGFKLSGERNAEVQTMLRQAAGWHEEHAEWAIVALTFPELFSSYERRIADRTIRDTWPDAWETIHGRRLAAGESHEKDRRAFQADHVGHWIVISALRSVHHADMTEVIATIGGNRDGTAQERRFLVPSAEYAPGRFGFVIDEASYDRYDGPSSFPGYPGRAG